MPRTSPSWRCLSRSSLVFSSMARISCIVSPCHWSIQQNTCLQESKHQTDNRRMKWIRNLPMERCEKPALRLLNKVLNATLKSEPFKFARDELVAGHHWANFLLPVSADQRSATRFWRLESVGSEIVLRSKVFTDKVSHNISIESKASQTNNLTWWDPQFHGNPLVQWDR